MKTARQSFNKEPFVCQKPWPEDCFCQCGGGGVVFTEGSMAEVLEKPEEQKEAIKAVLGEPSKKKHYRTAFFEAFPTNPSCFIRGEGPTIAEAEAKAFAKWEKILNCPGHQWDRRNRTDGYGYCTLCPLSGSFLEPLTKCFTCQIPTAEHTDKDKNYYCDDHYYQLTPEDAVGDKSILGSPPEELQDQFKEDAKLYNLIKHFNPKMNHELWKKCWDIFIRMRAQVNADYNPFFGPATKTEKEIHEMIMGDLPAIAYNIRQLLKIK